MKWLLHDVEMIQSWAEKQRGIFSKSDLQTALGERHPAAFVRRVDALVKNGVLSRFVRGWYVAKNFDLQVLSQRIVPSSYVSFGTILAEHLLIGANPKRRVMAVKIGRTKTYSALGYQIVHVGITRSYYFGYRVHRGVRKAEPEKALLDVLYFHLRGRRFVFDIYSDIRFDKLNMKKVREYLNHYQNPKFVVFVNNFLRSHRNGDKEQ